MSNKQDIPLWVKVLTWFLRFVCGGLFIFSGFVKAVDPWGTVFKVEDYLAALDINLLPPLLKLFVFGLCAVEFIVGCFLVLGCYRKTCPWFAALIMCFMLPLSLWTAITNPVPDCGCFGDALHISNWLTFGKNIILSAGIIWLIKYNVRCLCLITPAFQWLAVLASGVFVLVIEIIGFYFQPLIDFRNYPVGEGLYAMGGGEEEDMPELRFIYEKNGEKREFPLDSLPEEDEGWKFIERYEVKGDKTPEKEKKDSKEKLHVYDIDSEEDLTDELRDYSGKELIIMIPKVREVSPATTWKLNSLWEWSEANDVRMIGVIAGNKEDIEIWEDLSMASYPIYVADDTSIEEAVRGNPGVIYMDDGKIIWKTSLSSIDIDDFTAPEIRGAASIFDRDNAMILRYCVFAYLIIMAFLIFISFTPRMARLLTGLASKRGIRHH